MFSLCSTVQRISPEGSSKIQIQLVLHDGNSFTFQFTSEPQSNAKKERDDAKDLLAQLIPAHRKKSNKELEEKNRYTVLRNSFIKIMEIL